MNNYSTIDDKVEKINTYLLKIGSNIYYKAISITAPFVIGTIAGINDSQAKIIPGLRETKDATPELLGLYATKVTLDTATAKKRKRKEAFLTSTLSTPIIFAAGYFTGYMFDQISTQKLNM